MFCFFLDVLYLCSKNIMPMRKIAVTFFILVTYFCQANPIDVAKARQLAVTFIANSGSLKTIPRAHDAPQGQLSLAYTKKGKDGNVLYVFNRAGNQGFVMVSADDATTPILGFSDKGSFDAAKVSEGLQAIMDCYEQQVAWASMNSSKSATRSKKTARIAIEPLIQTQWDQHEPYNNLCPIDPDTGERSVLGCVAVAKAQLMYYHAYPLKGKGTCSYQWKGLTLSSDFSKVEFEWDKMKLTYDHDTPDPGDAVAKLIYNCAIASKANFGSELTFGFYNTSEFSEYFGYKDEIKWLSMANTTPAEFEDVVYQDLAKGLPVLFCVNDPDEWSHMLILDGYKGDGYFHMNFGWNGSDDGYYLLTAMDLGWVNFRTDQEILYNIQPDIPGKWFLRTNDDRFFEMSNVESLEAASDNDTYYNIYDSSGELLASKVSSVSFVYTTGTNPELCPKGDANCDGRVNAADIVETINAVRGNPSMRFIEFNADANSDGKIDSKDIEAIKNIILTSESATEN